MKKEEFKTIKLVPEAGNVLIYVEETPVGRYQKSGKQYDIVVSTEVYSPEQDAAVWIEAESLESFLEKNKFREINI